ncbi:uncharacterized protein E5676_scaffold202G00090 [Cucumis melo var. makuwa]|uniref:DUF4218 domain-containing protein n=1 Tax=Cucumis melo var. makuwa TaxID=1194695 RepID=A0A5A7VBM5_CUCMM|nr:uncharacterized protein E6C27_scaffold827G00450 [Cucumis melo var. makuwa]TYK07298.1 uncharacterized protein E5676_scaffold202G00090 [Cucumis melo var. makuwa]
MTQPSEDEPEVTILSPPVRQEEASSKLYESVLSESVPVVGESSVPASSISHAPRVFVTTVSDLDSNDPDDVPLARLLKRTLIPYVSDKLPVHPPNSIHSQESSSTEGVFIATPSIPLASNVQSGPSAHSPPASPPPFATVDAHESVPNDVPEVPPNDDDNLAVPSTSADIPTASKLAERKFQQKRCNITTKTGRKKIPPNIPSVPIDGISFHHEESVQCWKFVVLRGIADEVNVSDNFEYDHLDHNNNRPVHLRWMYPFERYMKVLKTYVRNRNRPEGCMVENYIVEEAIEFCSEFIAGVSSIGLNSSVIKKNSNMDRALSASSFIRPSKEQLDQAHLYVIQNVNDVLPYVEYVLNPIYSHSI